MGMLVGEEEAERGEKGPGARRPGEQRGRVDALWVEGAGGREGSSVWFPPGPLEVFFYMMQEMKFPFN